MGGKCDIIVDGQKREGPRCTDNFQVIEDKFKYNGHDWYSVEQCYQAQKFKEDSSEFQSILNISYNGEEDWDHGLNVWDLGQNGKIKENWEDIKLKTMLLVNLSKFQCDKLAEELVNSHPLGLVAQPSTWKWQKWNTLIMEFIRDLIILDWDLHTMIEDVQKMTKLEVIRLLENDQIYK